MADVRNIANIDLKIDNYDDDPDGL